HDRNVARPAPGAVPIRSRSVTVSSAMGLDFRILGPVEVVADAGSVRLGGPKQGAVLAILVLHANRVGPVGQLAGELYGEQAPPTAVAQVRDHVSQLRKLLEPEGARGSVLETRGPGYVLHVEPGYLDSSRFEQACEDAGRLLAAGSPREAA